MSDSMRRREVLDQLIELGHFPGPVWRYLTTTADPIDDLILNIEARYLAWVEDSKYAH